MVPFFWYKSDLNFHDGSLKIYFSFKIFHKSSLTLNHRSKSWPVEKIIWNFPTSPLENSPLSMHQRFLVRTCAYRSTIYKRKGTKEFVFEWWTRGESIKLDERTGRLMHVRRCNTWRSALFNHCSVPMGTPRYCLNYSRARAALSWRLSFAFHWNERQITLRGIPRERRIVPLVKINHDGAVSRI